MDGRRASSARLLAPLALVAFAFALVLVISGSDAPDDSDGDRGRASQRDRGTGTDTTATTTGEADGQVPRSYTVKTGDTLAAIAETVGVPVDRLLELNPDLDPQALVSGQKIRLRE
jgi:LysM repeat protein